MRLVLDANILLSTLTRDAFTPQAAELLDAQIDGRFQALSPHVVPNEIAHVLLKLYRLGRSSRDSATYAYYSARQLPFVAHRDDVLGERDLPDALRHGIGGSDFIYVRLTKELGCPLVTMDRALRTNAAALVETLDLDGALARLAL